MGQAVFYPKILENSYYGKYESTTSFHNSQFEGVALSAMHAAEPLVELHPLEIRG
jgi:hypothetical protein